MLHNFFRNLNFSCHDPTATVAETIHNHVPDTVPETSTKRHDLDQRSPITVTALPTAEYEDSGITTSRHKQVKGWVLYTEVRQSQLEGVGMDLFMLEKVKKNERVSRYYRELIGPTELEVRKSHGTEYIVRVNT